MEISFIIPLFNRLDLTVPCVESLRASIPDGLEHEIVLVDDGSTDGTREWAAAQCSPPFVFFANTTNLRYAATCNRAATLARGQVLTLLNNDLVFAPGWLEPMVRALRHHKRAGIVGNIHRRAVTGELDHAGMIINLQGKPEHLNHAQGPLRLWRAVSERPAVTSACCLIRRDLFLDHGGFDTSYRNGGEDVDLCYRLRRRGLRVLVANRSVVRHHVSASPGRKDFDEANCRQLCARWREACIIDGAASWPKAYLRQHWHDPRRYDTALLWQAVVRWLGLVRTPAWHARRTVEACLEVEEKRWRDLLGPANQVS